MTHDPTGPTPQTQGPLVVCGQVPVTHTSPTDAVSHMLGEIGARRRGEAQSGVAIHFVNAWTVVLAETDPLLTQVLAQDVNFPDGTPVVWHARMRGQARMVVHPMAGLGFELGLGLGFGKRAHVL